MFAKTIFPGVYKGENNDDLLLLIDNIKHADFKELNNYIKEIASEKRSSVCSMSIAQNEEHYNDGWSCDLVYNLTADKYYLYDVDYHVTFKTKIKHIQEAIDFTGKHFMNT